MQPVSYVKEPQPCCIICTHYSTPGWVARVIAAEKSPAEVVQSGGGVSCQKLPRLQAYLFQVFTLEPWGDLEPDVRLVQGLEACDVASQEAPAQGAVGHNGNAQLTAGGYHFSLQHPTCDCKLKGKSVQAFQCRQLSAGKSVQASFVHVWQLECKTHALPGSKTPASQSDDSAGCSAADL